MCLGVICSVVVCAEEVVNVIVEGGAIPALVQHLQAPPVAEEDLVQKPFPFEHEVEKGSAFALGLLAVKVASLFFSFFSNCCSGIITTELIYAVDSACSEVYTDV